MPVIATPRQPGRSSTPSIPEALADNTLLQRGSYVELTGDGGKRSVTSERQGLADRLDASPKTPAAWHRDDEWLADGQLGRELL